MPSVKHKILLAITLPRLSPHGVVFTTLLQQPDVARMQLGTMRISLKIFQRRRVRGFHVYKSKHSHKWKDFQATLRCINLGFDFGRGKRRGWLFEISQLHDKVTRSVTSLCARPALRESVSGYHPTLPTSGVQTSQNENLAHAIWEGRQCRNM